MVVVTSLCPSSSWTAEYRTRPQEGELLMNGETYGNWRVWQSQPCGRPLSQLSESRIRAGGVCTARGSQNRCNTLRPEIFIASPTPCSPRDIYDPRHSAERRVLTPVSDRTHIAVWSLQGAWSGVL